MMSKHGKSGLAIAILEKSKPHEYADHGLDEGHGEASEGGDEDQVLDEFLSAQEKGDKAAAKDALRSAIEMCVARAMQDDYKE